MSHYPSWLRKHSRKSHPDLPFNFISMETPQPPPLATATHDDDAGNYPPAAADDDGGDYDGNFRVDGGEIPPQESVSLSPAADEIPDNDDDENQLMTTGNAFPPTFYLP